MAVTKRLFAILICTPLAYGGCIPQVSDQTTDGTQQDVGDFVTIAGPCRRIENMTGRALKSDELTDPIANLILRPTQEGCPTSFGKILAKFEKTDSPQGTSECEYSAVMITEQAQLLAKTDDELKQDYR